jgi:polyisoprenoid-binding protein YceI
MHRIIRLLCLSALVAIATAGISLAELYQIDRGHSTVAFSIRHLVSRTTGKFTQFEGTINYDPATPKKTTVEATIQTASIDTENQRRDDHLRGADFFDVEKYPQITFKSTSAEQKGEMILVTGDLTMHGKTKSIKMPVEILGLGKHPRRGTPLGGFETELRLLCSDYGVNSYENFASVLGDEVKVTITIEAGKPRERRRQAQPAAK